MPAHSEPRTPYLLVPPRSPVPLQPIGVSMSAASMLGHMIANKEIDLGFTLVVAVMSTITVPLGERASRNVNRTLLRQGMSAILVLVGCFVIVRVAMS